MVVAGAAAGGAVVFYVTSRLTKLSSAGGKGISQGRSTAASGVAPGGGAAVYESSRAVQEYLAFHFLPPKVPRPELRVHGTIGWRLGRSHADSDGWTAGFGMT